MWSVHSLIFWTPGSSNNVSVNCKTFFLCAVRFFSNCSTLKTLILLPTLVYPLSLSSCLYDEFLKYRIKSNRTCWLTGKVLCVLICKLWAWVQIMSIYHTPLYPNAVWLFSSSYYMFETKLLKYTIYYRLSLLSPYPASWVKYLCS